MTMVTTKSAIVTIDPGGFVRMTMKQGVVDDLEAAVENVKAVIKLAHGKKLPLMVDTRPLKGQDKAARDYYRGTLHIELVTATAVLINSVLGSVLGNFHAFASKTAIIPFKLFHDEPSAVRWMKSLNPSSGRASPAPP